MNISKHLRQLNNSVVKPADLVVVNSYDDQVLNFESILLKPLGNLVVLSKNWGNLYSEIVTLHLASTGWTFLERIQLVRISDNKSNSLASKLRDDGHFLRFSRSKNSYCNLPKNQKNVWYVNEMSEEWFGRLLNYLCPTSGTVCEIGGETDFLKKSCQNGRSYERRKSENVETKGKDG